MNETWVGENRDAEVIAALRELVEHLELCGTCRSRLHCRDKHRLQMRVGIDPRRASFPPRARQEAVKKAA